MAECANQLWLGWVEEWLNVARQRNSNGITVYKNAYESLKACPVTFDHPAELQQLKGFGPKLCERLTDTLKKHCQQNGLPMPQHPKVRGAAAKRDNEVDEPTAPKRKKKGPPKAYVPAFRSGGYALIIGLSTLPQDITKSMTKTELIQVSQPHCDASLTAPSDPTKFYTAWNSIKTLIQKELVYESGRPLRRYALTEEGWDVAQRIKQTKEWRSENDGDTAAHHDPPPVAQVNRQPVERTLQRSPSPGIQAPAVQQSPYANVVSQGPTISGDDSLPDVTPIKLPPGSFSVHLVLDVREVRAKTDRDYMQDELAKQGVTPIMRSLEVGDAQWIAKCRDPDVLSRRGAEGDEVALDWIVERKRLDDLIGSIKDGRFHEQKFRLSRCGVKRVVYIVEEISMDTAAYQKYEEAVQSAIASLQVVNGYFVKRTSKMDETIKYLSRLTRQLKKDYESRTLNVIPTNVLTAQNYLPLLARLRREDAAASYHISYGAFASLASKSDMMTLRDVFLKMLMTTRGVTGERALEIQKRWKTPYDFVKAFEACGSGEQGQKRRWELVSSELDHLVGRKKISKPLSQKIADIWGDA
ncbi:Crossover junction endonuclease MUS81 [Ophiocordyceps camponoti-floridani]|uniref:Crossover junction endonuclease MUS81 n=1 Tax=Ophiocordyceps camponoti-floridani TaxID=2030778 RepID=A0A8H4VAS2_9HYPO|nr:Crossover junction endonuclease MUS81 [Ophiocordyceps camponoti-floridani]